MSEHGNPINGQVGPRRFERLRWPFERAGWALQDGFASLRDRFELLGRPAQALTGFAAVVIVLAAAAVGIGLAGSGGAPAEPASQLALEPPPATTAAVVEPDAEAEAEEQPTLAGAAPVFESPKKQRREQRQPSSGDGSGESDAPAGSGSASASASGSAATDTISSSPSNSASASASASQASASSSGADDNGPPAGKKALAVARDFAAGFVVFETGGEKAEVREAFAGSATKELTQSLLRRPPRLPANAKVPKAKVVNVVAGPSRGGVYPVSVSLLRVGLTSELRLEMEKVGGKRWRVTNVLG